MADASSKLPAIPRPDSPVLLTIIVCLASLLSPNFLFARTWHVPGDAPMIQEGINLASSGDDVLVAPGVYAEHDILMKGGVWVHSEQGPNSSIVDAGSVSRAFDCMSQGQPTMRNGLHSIWIDHYRLSNCEQSVLRLFRRGRAVDRQVLRCHRRNIKSSFR